ncbi:MAG: nucleotidyl transferase AbiEii/AbiGii toxin family protein [Anaerolineales bacterium]|nr:nucleotidyl transferase AbiEii/AbiGii toxin family protein [Anaerolineales bacterium]
MKLECPHWEALTPETQEAFRLVSELNLIQRFYLAGGTGLALHLGHRFSVDLDFFSQEPDAVGLSERTTLRENLDDPSLSITFDKDTTFVANWRGVGLSFFQLPQYPLVQPTLLLEGVPIATIEEIGAMKLAATIDRGTRKDLVDLYFILQQTTLENLFQVAAIKYSRVRTFAISATRALAYFNDAEALPMPKMIDKTPWSKMKRYLENQSMEAGRKNLEDLWK